VAAREVGELGRKDARDPLYRLFFPIRFPRHDDAGENKDKGQIPGYRGGILAAETEI
jgi:hypothetical protein